MADASCHPAIGSYERALEKTIRLVELVRDNGVSKDDSVLMRLCIREQLPLGLHWVGLASCVLNSLSHHRHG